MEKAGWLKPALGQKGAQRIGVGVVSCEPDGLRVGRILRESCELWGEQGFHAPGYGVAGIDPFD